MGRDALAKAKEGQKRKSKVKRVLLNGVPGVVIPNRCSHTLRTDSINTTRWLLSQMATYVII